MRAGRAQRDTVKRGTRSGAAAPGLRQVGAADPRRRNSPVQTDPGEPFERLREQIGDEAPCCHFIDKALVDTTGVLGTSRRLLCEQGIWDERAERQS